MSANQPVSKGKLDVVTYYDELQREYIESEIREKIYPYDKHKKHYQELMKIKRVKIEDIAMRNNLKSIFNDKKTHAQFIKLIYPSMGMPKFKRFQKFDMQNFYEVGRKAKAHISERESEYKVGTISNVDLDNRVATIEIDGSTTNIPLKFVTRII